MELKTVLNMVEEIGGMGISFDKDYNNQKIIEIEIRTKDLYRESMVEFIQTMLKESEVDINEHIYKVDIFDEWGEYIELRWWIA